MRYIALPPLQSVTRAATHPAPPDPREIVEAWTNKSSKRPSFPSHPQPNGSAFQRHGSDAKPTRDASQHFAQDDDGSSTLNAQGTN